jgi:Tfp pilus assembly protein PilN
LELRSVYPVKVNLLPARLVVKKTPNWVRLFFMVLLISLSVLYVFSFLMLSNKVFLSRAQVEELRSRVEILKREEQKLKDVEGRVAALEKRLDLLQSLVRAEPDWLQVFEAIGSSLPQDVYFESLKTSQGELRLEGKAFSIFSISQLMSFLSVQDRLFQEVELESLSLEESLYKFTLKVRLVGKSAS